MKITEADLDPEIDSIAIAENFYIEVTSEWNLVDGQISHWIDGESDFVFAAYIDGVLDRVRGYMTYETEQPLSMNDFEGISSTTLDHTWTAAGHEYRLIIDDNGDSTRFFDDVVIEDDL